MWDALYCCAVKRHSNCLFLTPAAVGDLGLGGKGGFGNCLSNVLWWQKAKEGEEDENWAKGFLTWAKGKEKSYSKHREFLFRGFVWGCKLKFKHGKRREAVTHFLGLLKWRLMRGPLFFLSFFFCPSVAAYVTTRRMEGRVLDGGENANSLSGSVGKKEILLTHTSRKFPNDQIIFFDLRFYTLLRFKNSLRIIWQLSVRLAFRILLCLPRRRNGGWSSIIKPDGPKRYIMNDS